MLQGFRVYEVVIIMTPRIPGNAYHKAICSNDEPKDSPLGIFLPCPKNPPFHPGNGLAWPCAHLPGFQWCSMGSTSSLPPMVVVVTMPITHWQRKATQLHNFPLILPTWKSKKSLKPTNHSWMEIPKTLQVIPLPPCGVQWKKLTARHWKLMAFADYIPFGRLLPGEPTNHRGSWWAVELPNFKVTELSNANVACCIEGIAPTTCFKLRPWDTGDTVELLLPNGGAIPTDGRKKRHWLFNILGDPKLFQHQTSCGNDKFSVPTGIQEIWKANSFFSYGKSPWTSRWCVERQGGH